MGRIRNAYELKFRQTLGRFRARQLERGVQTLIQRAEHLSREKELSLPHAYALVQSKLCRKLNRWQHPIDQSGSASEDRTIHFLCDAGLGGLARWLRAAGYDATWNPQIDDDQLIQEAVRTSAILLTTDSLMMERRVLRDGIIPGLWVPPTLTMLEQLQVVFEELHLPVLPSRCMQCGGELLPVDKEAMRDRIPPKTYRWRNEYFLCQRCGKLFWHGTHWDRIKKQLGSTTP